MEKAVRRIGVFTSGGDAPGMNAAIRAVVRTSLHMGIECVGIRRARLAGRTHFMIIVAEGVEGGAYSIGKVIEEATALDTRVTVLGHIQRGGSPTARDRETASRMGYAAVKALAEGRMNCIVGTNEGHLVEIPIEKALNMTKHLQMERYEVLEAMHNQVPLKCGPIQ